MRSIVIGADGVVGGALLQALKRRGDIVYGTTRRSSRVTEFMQVVDLAASNIDEVVLPAADIAYFCAAITSFSECRNNPILAHKVNVTGPVSIAGRLVAAGTRVVLLSTSAVYDWRLPHVPATYPPCPTTVYGELKAEAEKAFAALGARASIVRFTKLLSPEFKLIIGWIEALSHRRSVVAFSDLHMAPISIDDAIAALLVVADDRGGGIFQVSGATDISYLEAARYLAVRLRADSELAIERRAIDARIPPEEIIRFSSLDTLRLTSMTGWLPPDPYAVIDAVYGSSIDSARARATTQ
jgi:dTDP-4-dehydrorhamnose reductase